MTTELLRNIEKAGLRHTVWSDYGLSDFHSIRYVISGHLFLKIFQAAEESDTAGKDESVEASDPLVTKSQQSTASSTVEDDSIQFTVLGS